MMRTTLIICCGLLAAAACERSLAPEAPTLTGPDWGVVGETLEFAVAVSDPDGDLVAFRFVWDGGDTTGWTGFVEPGVHLLREFGWASSGTYEVSAQARDEAGQHSPWSSPRTVNILPRPGYPDTVLARVEYDWYFNDLLLSASGDSLIALVSCGLLILDAATGGFVDTVCFSTTYPRCLGRAPGGELYVGHQEGILVLDPVSLAVVDTLHDVEGVEDLEVTPDGNFICVSSDNDVVVISVSSREVVARSRASDRNLGDIAVHPDGDRVYVPDERGGRVLVLGLPGLDSLAVVPHRMFRDQGLAVHPGGAYLYVACGEFWDVVVVRTRDNAVAGGLRLGYRPRCLCVTPDGGYLCAAADYHKLSIVDTENHAVVDSIDAGGLGRVLLSPPDGRRLYAADDSLMILGFRE